MVESRSAHLSLGFQVEAHPPDHHLLLLQLLRRHAVHFILCGNMKRSELTALPSQTLSERSDLLLTSVLQRVDFEVVLVLQIFQVLDVLIRHLSEKQRADVGSFRHISAA